MWYMTKENYREMRLGKITQVFVPLFEEYYTLNLYGIINLPLEEKCTAITPSGDPVLIEITDIKLNRLEYPIAATEGNSGVYSLNCSIAFHDVVDGHKHTLVAIKSLNITFIRGGSINVCGDTMRSVTDRTQDILGGGGGLYKIFPSECNIFGHSGPCLHRVSPELL